MGQNNSANNKRIAKNTIALYLRMMFTMVVSLYTSRVILQNLGVEDFGIYNTVGGVVAMLSYLNSALSVGSSRFLTYELGTGNKLKLAKVFSSVLSVHIIFATIILLLGETIGLWFVYHKLNIPTERLNAALWCYHISLLTCMITIIQVPYNASIMSHERMNIYAYISIVEVIAKLVIVYLIVLTAWDNLIVYTILLFFVTLGIMSFYIWYCLRHFKETHYVLTLDRIILKEVLNYSGWNVFATTAVALCAQGVTIVTNMFFNPSVVAARAIANQVDHATRMFFTNFKAASNPQIVKSFAAGDLERSKFLVLQTAKYGYFLMLLLGLPIILIANPLLFIWLGQVPEYSVAYLQLAILTSLAAVFDLSFYAALYAKGRIKENSIISSSCFFVGFVAIFILFKLGFSPIWSGVVLFICQCVIAFIVKPIIIVKILAYNYNEILILFWDCMKITLLSALIPVLLYQYRELFPNYLYEFLVLTLVSFICVGITIWYMGLDESIKIFLKTKINSIL